MRVAMLSWESAHSIVQGSVATHVSELAAGLTRRGHDVHVFTRIGPGQERHEQIDGVFYHRCPAETRSELLENVQNVGNSFAWHFGEANYFLGNGGFDVVHGHDWLCTPALVQAKNDHRKPVVLTLHSTEFGRCGNQLAGGQSERIRRMEWEGTYVANRVICVSEALAREAWHLYQFPEQKTDCVYNGVRVERYDPPVNRETTRTNYGITADNTVLLYVGRLSYRKGPDILLHSLPTILAEYPQVTAVFVGDGDMRGDLQQQAADAGLSERVKFLGYRNGSELVSLFKSSDLVCVPSRNEPFGDVILEAWSASQPVVTSRNGGPAEYVRHGYDGLMVVDQPDSVAWGVCTMLDDQDRARWMGGNGREHVESRFTWDHAAAETEEVYEAARGG